MSNSYISSLSSLFDSSEQQGKTVDKIISAIEGTNFSNSYKIDGILIHTREGLLSVADTQQDKV